MAIRATRCVADDYHAITKHAKADHPLLAVALACVFGLEERLLKHILGVFEVQHPFCQRLGSLLGVVGNRHTVSVSTSTAEGKSAEFVTPNVRAKRMTTAGCQARAGENVQRTTGPGLVACRWHSA